jgi:flagellar FliJ protein
MADLDALIRLRKHVVDQKQKFLAELYRQAEELQSQKKNLLTTLEEERNNLRDLGPQMLPYFGPYSEAVKDRVADIDEAMKKLDARIEVARDTMREAFAELKKIEITQERREDEAQAALDKKEAQDLDEMALEGFRRKAADQE